MFKISFNALATFWQFNTEEQIEYDDLHEYFTVTFNNGIVFKPTDKFVKLFIYKIDNPYSLTNCFKTKTEAVNEAFKIFMQYFKWAMKY